jgi:hypothetical protein
MPLFAYSGGWYPSLNPVGIWSLGAALIAAASWFLVERRFLSSERRHAWLMLLAPLFLLAFVFCSKVRLDPLEPLSFRYDWRRYRFPDAQDYVADYIFVAVGILLSWKAVRLPFCDLRVVGFAELALALTFLALESAFLYRRFYAG